MPKRKTNVNDLFYSDAPEAAAWRAEQADIDADIEGLARNPETELMVAKMEA